MRTRDRVKSYAAEHPDATVREIQSALKLSSPSVVQHHLKWPSVAEMTFRLKRLSIADMRSATRDERAEFAKVCRALAAEAER